MRSLLIALGVFLAGACLAQEQNPVITLKMMGGPAFGIPPKEDTNPRSIARRAIFDDFRKENPGIDLVNAGGLEIVGQQADSVFLMSMAGDNAPDVFYVNFRQYYNYIEQGFCRPLDDFLKTDAHAMDRVSPVIQKVLRSYDEHIYAVPWYNVAQALYYRKDFFAAAGLDPNRPPKTWDEFRDYSRKIAEKFPDKVGFNFPNDSGYIWVNFLWQAGGEAVVPGAGGYWKSALATPETAKAVDYYRDLVTTTWKGADGKTYGPAVGLTADYSGDIGRGKTAMWFNYTTDVLMNQTDLPPSVIGIAGMPAGPAGPQHEINAGMWAINSRIKDPAKLAACWKFISYFSGDSAARVSTENFVEQGLGELVNPVWLKKFGDGDLADRADPAYVKANEELFAMGHPEPYGRNCQQIYTMLDNLLQRARLSPSTPAMSILKETEKEMNSKLLGYTPPDVLAKQRAWALGIFVGLTLGLIGLVIWLWKKSHEVRAQLLTTPGGKLPSAARKFVAFGLLPASLSLLLWSYYPLARGLTIAFQDYRIAKDPQWVGLDNFIAVFTQPVFYRSLGNSLIYVSLLIGIGFALPIALALMLNEIPRGKTLFRTLYYLPAMTSPMVIALLWRQFYEKGDKGLLNTLLKPAIDFFNAHLRFGAPPIATAYDWLNDPHLAMFAVVVPAVWAAAGPGSILYLAALKNIPEERYEAADLDGANWIHKIRAITLPGIRPLMLINLLGVFVGGFKAMENIFVLTMGGPLYSTHTIGLEIWTNAFMFLKFGYATAAAWVMGAILIAFTVIQIRTLLRMKFSTSKL